MDFAPVTAAELSRSFRTALLLTGNARQTEAAIMDVIRSADCDEAPGQQLFAGAVTAALLPAREAPAQSVDLDQRFIDAPTRTQTRTAASPGSS